MQDIIKKYRQHKLLSNLNIILASLVMAFGINFLLIDGTNLGQSLKTSVLNSQVENRKADISIENIENTLYVVANSDIKQVTNISLSLTYNPDNLSITNVNSNYGDLVNLTNTPGISSIIFTSEKAIDINKGDKLMKINANKQENKSENINIVNANFTDINKDNFLLSTSGITF